jgi:hypothetical protein
VQLVPINVTIYPYEVKRGLAVRHDQSNGVRSNTGEHKRNRDLNARNSAFSLLTSLQRKIGNQAVMQLLSKTDAQSDKRKYNPSTNPIIQRKLMEFVPDLVAPVAAKDLKDDELQKLKELITHASNEAGKIDELVTAGHTEVQNVINNVIEGKLEVNKVADQFPYSTHAQNFQNKLMDYISGEYSVHPSAPGGYLIEDYATNKVGNGIFTQVVPDDLNGSRPDFMIPLTTNADGPGNRDYYGLVDATSDHSIGHVLKKGDGAWTKRIRYPYVAETVYEQLYIKKPKRKFTQEEREAMQQREINKMKEIEEARARERAILKERFQETFSMLSQLINNNYQLPKIFQLSSSRTQSLLEHIGITFNLETNQVTTINFEEWFQNKEESKSMKHESMIEPNIHQKASALNKIYEWLKSLGL